MKVAIIDYGSGNLHSAAKAFQKALTEIGKGTVIITSDPKEIEQSSHVVLPGVGSFRQCKNAVLSISGMMDSLKTHVSIKKQPFLGICVGMQLMAELGEENGKTKGFGWIRGSVVPLAPPRFANLKIPHMGWNDLEISKPVHPVLADIPDFAHAYFVHSFHFNAKHPSDVLAQVDYGEPI
ncbi:MAG: imidazole glycerol phosphate synthase subunit HisH, partial [Pseudomonadota bacterium]|nr:imidazole glycerol phosphate synthase subunit HisH [Pseudomonadota bacterium]